MVQAHVIFDDLVSRMNGSPGSLTINQNSLLALTPRGRELLRAIDEDVDDDDG
jgi:hypothetical protein